MIRMNKQFVRKTTMTRGIYMSRVKDESEQEKRKLSTLKTKSHDKSSLERQHICKAMANCISMTLYKSEHTSHFACQIKYFYCPCKLLCVS
jgi:hypothetical protein